MEPGSKKATIAGSEDLPGPHVPWTAGLGSATSKPVIAKAAPKSPKNTKINLNLRRGAGSITCDPLSTERDDRPGAGPRRHTRLIQPPDESVGWAASLAEPAGRGRR
jgi:hypothetical protein